MNELDTSVLTAITHGHVDTLLQSGYKPEYSEDPDARVIFKTALSLLHRQPPVKPNKLNLLAGAYGELANPQEVKAILSMNGTGENAPEIIARKCKERHVAARLREWQRRFDQLLREKPGEAAAWMPKMSQEFEMLAATAQGIPVVGPTTARPDGHGPARTNTDKEGPRGEGFVSVSARDRP